jgi:hypothetical protein
LPPAAAPFSGAAGIPAGDCNVLQQSAIDMDRDSIGAARAGKVSHLVKAGRSQRRRVAC